TALASSKSLTLSTQSAVQRGFFTVNPTKPEKLVSLQTVKIQDSEASLVIETNAVVLEEALIHLTAGDEVMKSNDYRQALKAYEAGLRCLTAHSSRIALEDWSDEQARLHEDLAGRIRGVQSLLDSQKGLRISQ
ncbi:MAG: hypothetical protein ACX932_02055, partial [Gammaproteobacteria bacterium]